MKADFIRSSVLGTAVGDALGVPAEFRSRDVLEQDPITGMVGFGTHNQPAGSWSDDTSMLLATLDSLRNGYDPEDIMNRFEDWLFNGAYTPRGVTFDRGLIVQKAVDRHRRGKKAILCGGADIQDNGNGSLMRILPASLYALAKQEKGEMDDAQAVQLVHEVSGLTHAHVISKAGCGLHHFLVKALIEDASGGLRAALQRGVDAGVAWYRENDWYNYRDAVDCYSRIFDLAALGVLPSDSISSKGYVVSTLEAALWCLLNADSLEEALLRAVNLGRDTDTVAAVAGGLAGLWYGEGAIPKLWLDTLLRRDFILDLCEKAAASW